MIESLGCGSQRFVREFARNKCLVDENAFAESYGLVAIITANDVECG
jgi:hypothetical protein